MNILEHVACIQLDVRLWSGQRKLCPADLKLAAGSEIPPATLASLGSKRLCDPRDLAPGVMYKKRAERQLDATGVRFLGGWAIPLEQIDPLDTVLAQLWQEADAWKQTFLACYDQVIQDWITANPGWEDLIRRAVEPVERIAGRIQFSHQLFRVAPVAPPDQDAAGHNAGLAATTAALGQRLLQEIARQAREVWIESFQGRDQVTRRALRPIQAMGEKLQGFSFIDPVVTPLVERIRLCLAALPKTGPIQGNDLNALTGLLFLLSDPERLHEHGQAVLAGRQAAGDEVLALPAAALLDGFGEGLPADDVESEAVAAGVDASEANLTAPETVATESAAVTAESPPPSSAGAESTSSRTSAPAWFW